MWKEKKELRKKISVISREKNKKSILQFSLEGKLIKKYEAVLDACREHDYEPSALSRAASVNRKQATDICGDGAKKV